MKKYGLLIVFGHIGLLAVAQTSYQDGARELAATRARNQGSLPICKTCNSDLMPTVRVLSYKVDGNAGYFVSGCVPRSDVELYSTSSGGQVLARKAADDKGQANFSLSKGQQPAFALNHNRRNANGVSGNAQLFNIGTRDLVLGNLKLNAAGNEVRITWSAAALASDWTFVLQRSRDNQRFEDVETVAPRGNAILGSYAVTQAPPAETPVAYYRVEARHSSGFSIATGSEPLKIAVPAFFQAVPTVFTSSVQMVIAPERLPAHYTVSDLSGHNQLYAGVLSSARQSLALKLNAGYYLVTVTDKKGATSSQVIIKN